MGKSTHFSGQPKPFNAKMDEETRLIFQQSSPPLPLPTLPNRPRKAEKGRTWKHEQEWQQRGENGRKKLFLNLLIHIKKSVFLQSEI